MGILRSLGALARALGPVVSSSGEEKNCKYYFIPTCCLNVIDALGQVMTVFKQHN